MFVETLLVRFPPVRRVTKKILMLVLGGFDWQTVTYDTAGGVKNKTGGLLHALLKTLLWATEKRRIFLKNYDIEIRQS